MIEEGGVESLLRAQQKNVRDASGNFQHTRRPSRTKMLSLSLSLSRLSSLLTISLFLYLFF